MLLNTCASSSSSHYYHWNQMMSYTINNELLSNDLLLSIFDKISIVHRKRLARVCRRWQRLIDITFLWVTTFSAVDDRKCVTDWKPSHWMGIKFTSPDNYMRIPKVSASELLSKTIGALPNLNALDLECCDMNNRIIRDILSSCKKIERINFDSSTRLNYYSFNLIVQDWKRLKHVNLSCCTDVTEVSARLLIQNLPLLESLNLCGTKLSGACLGHLNENLKRLDISYCWAVQNEGLTALANSKCINLEELSVNNFDFDGAENCLIALMSHFTKLKYLQMSIGPCVAHEYFIDRITPRGFTTISKLQNLETLIIEKICALDNATLVAIMKGCSKLKYLKLNLGWLNYCNDMSFATIDTLLPNLEELHILYPMDLTCFALRGLPKLKNLRSLSLVSAGIGNDVFKLIGKLDHLNNINFDECRKITLKGMITLFQIANRRSHDKINASLLGTGIIVARVRNRKNFPRNLIAQVSSFRASKTLLQLPPPPTLTSSTLAPM